MPLIKSAKKKLRQDVKRTVQNKKVKDTFRKTVKKAKTNPSAKTVMEAFSIIDKTAKKNIIHKNKASRMKSALSKLITTGKTSGKTGKLKTQKIKSKTAVK